MVTQGEITIADVHGLRGAPIGPLWAGLTWQTKEGIYRLQQLQKKVTYGNLYKPTKM